jgi:chemotaxis protein histidine kinase CheA
LPDRIRNVRERISALTPETVHGSAIAECRAEVHSLAGSSGLFGFDDVGTATSELERMIIALMKTDALSHAAKEKLLDALNKLEQVAHRSGV